MPSVRAPVILLVVAASACGGGSSPGEAPLAAPWVGFVVYPLDTISGRQAADTTAMWTLRYRDANGWHDTSRVYHALPEVAWQWSPTDPPPLEGVLTFAGPSYVTARVRLEDVLSERTEDTWFPTETLRVQRLKPWVQRVWRDTLLHPSADSFAIGAIISSVGSMAWTRSSLLVWQATGCGWTSCQTYLDSLPARDWSLAARGAGLAEVATPAVLRRVEQPTVSFSLTDDEGRQSTIVCGVPSASCRDIETFGQMPSQREP